METFKPMNKSILPIYTQEGLISYVRTLEEAISLACALLKGDMVPIDGSSGKKAALEELENALGRKVK